MGPLPLHKDVKVESTTTAAPETAAPAVLQDGSYATQSYIPSTSEDQDVDNVLPLHHLLLTPSFFACAALSSALTKLCVKLEAVEGEACKAVKLEVLLVLAELLAEYDTTMDSLNKSRIQLCVNCLLDPTLTAIMRDRLMVESHKVFDALVTKNAKKETKQMITRPAHSDVDDVIVFRQLRDKSSLGIMIDIDDNAAVKAVTESDKELTYDDKLKRVHQLTGYSDPVYCESVVYMKDFDIVCEEYWFSYFQNRLILNFLTF